MSHERDDGFLDVQSGYHKLEKKVCFGKMFLIRSF